MNLELRWLRSFLAVADELSFSRAARKLHIAQPALTAHVKQLEQAVGTRLFDRTNRINDLTAAGKALVGESQAIVGRANSLAQTARRAKDGQTLTLRVGLIPPAAIRVIAETLRLFSRQLPAVEVTVRQDNQYELVERLTDGELDLVLGRPLKTRKRRKIFQRPVLVEEQGVVLREDDPFAESSTIPLRKLHGTPLVLLRGNVYFGRNILELAARRGVELAPKYLAEDFPSLHWMVRAGLGVAPCSLLLSDSLPLGLTVRRLSPAPHRLPIHALWLGAKPVPIAAQLLELLGSCVDRTPRNG